MSKSVLDKVRRLAAVEQQLVDCKATLYTLEDTFEDTMEETDATIAELEEERDELLRRPDADKGDVHTLARWAVATLNGLAELGQLDMDERIALDAARRLENV